jgi:hypothetical protein
MTMKKIFAAVVVVAGLAMAAAPMMAQSTPQTQLAPSSAGSNAASTTYTTDEILPLTVHQAWVMSGKDEGKFFEIVTQLAELSAKNRNLQLPETAEAGRKAGEMIKMMAKKDTDQLLFAVVDAAVRKIGTPMATTTGQ